LGPGWVSPMDRNLGSCFPGWIGIWYLAGHLRRIGTRGVAGICGWIGIGFLLGISDALELVGVLLKFTDGVGIGYSMGVSYGLELMVL